MPSAPPASDPADLFAADIFDEDGDFRPLASGATAATHVAPISPVLSRRMMLPLLGLPALALVGMAARPALRKASQWVAPPQADAQAIAGWHAFKKTYLHSDGRVVDTGNGGISHSEGQGMALVFAASFGDRDAFDRAWGWTRATLRRAGDHLHAWRYRPSDANPVSDRNSATDGDLLIALGLALAARRWKDPVAQAEAKAIGRDLATLVVRKVGGRTLLLPGADGFLFRDRVVINPSYYVFPALQELAALMPDGPWPLVMRDGVALLREAAFGRWSLPPDWLDVPTDGGPMAPSADWPPRFSYDAVRVPLYLVWAGMSSQPVVAAVDRFWSEAAGPPAWVDVGTDGLANYSLTVGEQAIRALVSARLSGAAQATLPSVDRAPDYYAGALVLLSHVADLTAPAGLSAPPDMGRLGAIRG